MAIDSTELTFVRCPSCRSLVPAVSTRCRMCGASLDVAGGQAAGNASEVPAESTKATSDSVDESDLDSVDDSLEAGGDDPLSAYIDEVDVDDDSSDDDILSDDEFDELLDSILDPADEDDVDVLDDLPDEDPLAASESVETEDEDFAPDQSSPDVIIESGRRKPGQKSQLSFGSQKESAAPEEPQEEIDPLEDLLEEVQEAAPVEPEPTPPAPVPTPEPQVAAPVVKEQPAREVAKEAFQAQEPRSKPKKKKKSPAPRPEQRPESAQESRVVEFSAKKADDQSGRLFGWLVSYATPDGQSIEIREGKFFISGSSIRGNDLVLDHESVSAPHAMATVSASAGFRVQDLMSEHGIFIREKGSSSYQPVEEVVKLENGMWVRFGDVEFLVSLIPYVGQA